MASLEATEKPSVQSTVGLTRIASYGLLAVVLASLVNGLVRVLALTVFDVPNVFALWWGPVLIASAVGAIGATIVYAILTRVSNKPNRTFIIAATIVLVLSFVGPLNAFLSPPPELANAPWSMFATLMVMDVATAVTSIGVLTRGANQEVESR